MRRTVEIIPKPEWPECIQCGSDETTVVPKTGEWTCQTCGLQWTPEETPVDDGDAKHVPRYIEGLLRVLAQGEDEDG